MHCPRMPTGLRVLLLLQAASLVMAQVPVGNLCGRPMDVVFVLAKSTSLGETNFNTIKTTLNTAVDVLQISASEVRVGAVFYGTATDVVDLQVTAAGFKGKITALTYSAPGANAALGITEATRILTAARRPKVPTVIMLITNENSVDRPATLLARNSAVNAGVDLWATSIGPSVDTGEILALASTSKEMLYITAINQIPYALASLTKTVCERSVLRPDLTALPPVSPLEAICQQSPLFDGIRYIHYPEDCTQVLQCYENPTTKRYLVITRKCPTGQFWDQAAFKCAPSWTVDCPHDQCKGCIPNQSPPRPALPDAEAKGSTSSAARTYSMGNSGPCGGYWECKGGRSYPRCCPMLMDYTADQGCAKNKVQCWDSCNVDGTCADGIAPCFKYPVWTAKTRFLSTLTPVNGPVVQTCPYGGQFDVTRCRCQDKLMDLLKNRPVLACNAAHQDHQPTVCDQPGLPIPVNLRQANGAVAAIVLRVGIQTVTPGFQIGMSSDGADQFAFLITGNSAGVHGSMSSSSQKRMPRHATTLFMDATGPLDIKLMYKDNLLTLSVTQGTLTHISQAEVATPNICKDCRMFLTFSGPQGCTRKQLEIYGCETDLHNL